VPRTLLVAALAVLALVVVAVGCGGDDSPDPEKDSDQAHLNSALAHELTMVEAYAQALPRLRDSRFAVVAREFRAQEQEYVNAITKALRGLGGETEAEAEEVDLSEVKSEADLLTLLYELENEAYDIYVGASPQLYTEAPRILATSLAASHAQHLVLLRQGLGAGPAASASEAFESGEVPPPEVEEPVKGERPAEDPGASGSPDAPRAPAAPAGKR
jgi:rubrerythrin